MKKKLSLLMVALVAVAAFATTLTWKVTKETEEQTTIAKESTLLDDAALTVKTVYDANLAGGYTYESGEEFTSAIQVRVSDNISASNPIGGEQSGSTPLVVTAKKNVTATVFYRRQSTAQTDNKGTYDSNDGKDLKVYKNGTAIDGTLTIAAETEDGKYGYAKKEYTLEAGTQYTFAAKGTTIQFYGITYTYEDAPVVANKAIYLKPGLWNVDGARFAAWAWAGSAEGAWYDFVAVEGAEGYFSAEIPENSTGLTLVRMNGATTENNWDNKWNQTSDIDITDFEENTLFKITAWDAYEKTTYPETTEPDPEPTTDPVVLDFTSQDNWNIPTSGTNTTEASFTDGKTTIKLYSTSNYKLNNGYLILGKSGSYLELPAFDFDVEKIEVVGTSGASASVVQNIYVDDVAVSTETTGARDVTNTYNIAEAYQAAGNIYRLKVTSNHNTQISTLTVYPKSGEEPTVKTYTASFVTNLAWEKVFAYTWTTGETDRNAAWPGVEITDTKTDGVYTYSFDATSAPAKIIFNNGEGSQTGDLVFMDGKKYLHIVSSADAPLTVAQAIDAIDAGIDESTEVYVQGIISKIDGFLETYKSITYWISADGTEEGQQFEVYSGKGLEGADFSSVDDVAVGAKVVVKGNIKKYNDTYEFNYSSQLVKYEVEEPQPDAEITKVVFLGSFNEWNQDAEMTKAAEGNVWTATVDATEITGDIEFKLLVNGDQWIGNGSTMTIDAPEGWVEGQEEGDWNYVLKNATSGFQTYTVTATWETNSSATDGWTLKIEGKDARPVPATDIEISPAEGDIAAALATAKEGVAKVGNITINLTAGVTYTVSAPLVAYKNFEIQANGATIDASALEGNLIEMNSIEAPTEWTAIDYVSIHSATVKGLKKALFYSGCKNYDINWLTIDNSVIELAADATTIDFTKGSVARNFNVENSTIYAPTATTKQFYSSQAGQKATEAADDAVQSFIFKNSTLYNLAPGKNFFSHRQNSQKWLTFIAKNNIFVNCGKSGQVIKGMNGGSASANPSFDIDGNIFNFNGADTSAAEDTGDADEPVKNSVAGVVTFTDAAAGDFSGEFQLAVGAAVPESVGDPRWTLNFVENAVYTLVGSFQKWNGDEADEEVAVTGLFATKWDAENAENPNTLVKDEESGKYTLSFENIELPSKGNILYKVVKNHSWDVSYGTDTNGDCYYWINEAGIYKMTFTFDPNATGTDWFVSCTAEKTGDPTGINAVKAEQLKGAVIYNLNGQRVENAQKGLFIVNGRKVVIK